MIKFAQNWWVFLVLSLTLGLAPFAPEPHIWGKLKWISGGAEGMQMMDWFDFVMHGTPWLLFLISGVLRIKYQIEKRGPFGQ